jgi:hypothetical protein
MRIVAIGASDLSFFDRMVRREAREPQYIWMAFVARLRFIHRHRESLRPVNRGVADVNNTLDACVGMRVVAVGTRDSSQIMRRGVPRRVRRRSIMTLQAKLLPRRWQDIAVRVMARSTIQTIGAMNLMRMGNLFEFMLFAMTLVADFRRYRPQVVRSSAK